MAAVPPPSTPASPFEAPWAAKMSPSPPFSPPAPLRALPAWRVTEARQAQLPTVVQTMAVPVPVPVLAPQAAHLQGEREALRKSRVELHRASGALEAEYAGRLKELQSAAEVLEEIFGRAQAAERQAAEDSAAGVRLAEAAQAAQARASAEAAEAGQSLAAEALQARETAEAARKRAEEQASQAAVARQVAEEDRQAADRRALMALGQRSAAEADFRAAGEMAEREASARARAEAQARAAQGERSFLKAKVSQLLLQREADRAAQDGLWEQLEAAVSHFEAGFDAKNRHLEAQVTQLENERDEWQAQCLATRMEARAKLSATAAKALGELSKSGGRANMGLCFSAWWGIVEACHREAAEDLRCRAEAALRRKFERTAGAFCMSSDRILRRICFGVWLDVAERAAQKLAERARKSATAMKACARFCQATSASALRLCLEAWRQACEASRRESLEAVRNHHVTGLHAKAMGCWAASSDRALRASCFFGWSRVLRDDRACRSAEAAGRQAAVLEAQRSAEALSLRLEEAERRAAQEQLKAEKAAQEIARLESARQEAEVAGKKAAQEAARLELERQLVDIHAEARLAAREEQAKELEQQVAGLTSALREADTRALQSESTIRRLQEKLGLLTTDWLAQRQAVTHPGDAEAVLQKSDDAVQRWLSEQHRSTSLITKSKAQALRLTSTAPSRRMVAEGQ